MLNFVILNINRLFENLIILFLSIRRSILQINNIFIKLFIFSPKKILIKFLEAHRINTEL